MRSSSKNPSLFFYVLVAALGGFLFGYNSSIIAGALLIIRSEISLSLMKQSMVVAASLAGAFAGVILAGQLSDRFGRRFTMIVATFLIVLGGIFLLFATSLLGLLIGRVVVGFGIGLASLVAPLYIAEISPEERRGSYITTFQIAITLGILSGYLMNFFLAKSGNWRLMFGLTILPATLQFIGLLFSPDSPSFLTAKGKSAIRTLKRLGREGDLEKIEEETRKNLAASKGVSWKDFFKKPLNLALAAGVGLGLIVQFSGINTIIYFAPHIFQISGFDNDHDAITVTIGIGVVNLLATFIALLLIDKWGRKPLLYVGLGGMVATLITLSIALLVNSQTMPIVTAVSLMLFVAFFSLSLGPVAWVIISEIFPLRMRGRAMSLAILASWIANIFVSTSFLHLVEKITLPGTFLLYGMVGLLGLFFVYYFVPETKGKSLEQIEREYYGKSRN